MSDQRSRRSEADEVTTVADLLAHDDPTSISESLRLTVVPLPPPTVNRKVSAAEQGFGGALVAGVDYPIPPRPEPPPIPNGWYAAASTADLAVGDIASVIAVGRALRRRSYRRFDHSMSVSRLAVRRRWPMRGYPLCKREDPVKGLPVDVPGARAGRLRLLLVSRGRQGAVL